MVHVELDRLLSSRELRGSKALADLLRYCVEQTLANNVQQLKEYWIGVNVFRRGEDFDPRPTRSCACRPGACATNWRHTTARTLNTK